MTNNQYAHAILDDAEPEMKWKPVQIYAPEVALSNIVNLGRLRCLLERGTQRGVELVRKLLAGDTFVIVQDSRDVRSNLPMKFQTRQPRRPWMWESSCSREIP